MHDFLTLAKERQNDIYKESDAEYKKKLHEYNNTVDDIHKEVIANIEPLLSFKRLEEICGHSFYMLFEGLIIKFDCELINHRGANLPKLKVNPHTLKIIHEELETFTDKILDKINQGNSNCSAEEDALFEKDNIDDVLEKFEVEVI